jgi:hypothetical protein
MVDLILEAGLTDLVQALKLIEINRIRRRDEFGSLLLAE